MRRTSDLPSRGDLVVIGSGIVGAATAFFASRAGISVLVVERRPALCSMTTAIAVGGYRLQLEHREELELVGRSVRLFERFAEETGQTLHDPGLRAQGYLWLARTEAAVARQRELGERQRGWGVDGVELLTGDEARSRFAWVPDDVVQARFRQGDGLIEPKRIAMGLLEGSPADGRGHRPRDGGGRCRRGCRRSVVRAAYAAGRGGAARLGGAPPTGRAVGCAGGATRRAHDGR